MNTVLDNDTKLVIEKFIYIYISMYNISVQNNFFSFVKLHNILIFVLFLMKLFIFVTFQ